MPQVPLRLPVGVTVRDPYGHQYVIEGLLGKGERDTVYLVRDRHFKQDVFALKEVIDPSPQDREHFIFEGTLLMGLQHQVLPHVYCVFEHEKLKRVYLLMEYIVGRDLESLRREQPEQRFSLPVALDLLAPIADALSYLHTQAPPIVHRDIKPANMIIPMGTKPTMLVNFGFAKHYHSDGTTALVRRGTPGYAAPEQYSSGTDPRTDIYALGATLYALVTGIVPPDAISRIIKYEGTEVLKPAHLLTPTIPEVVARAIDRSMSINVEKRFATVAEFWWALTAP